MSIAGVPLPRFSTCRNCGGSIALDTISATPGAYIDSVSQYVHQGTGLADCASVLRVDGDEPPVLMALTEHDGEFAEPIEWGEPT